MGLQHNNFDSVQGFAPTVGLVVAAATPLDVTNILALKPLTSVTYTIGSDTVDLVWAAHDAEVIDSGVSTITFATEVTVKVMYK